MLDLYDVVMGDGRRFKEVALSTLVSGGAWSVTGGEL